MDICCSTSDTDCSYANKKEEICDNKNKRKKHRFQCNDKDMYDTAKLCLEGYTPFYKKKKTDSGNFYSVPHRLF